MDCLNAQTRITSYVDGGLADNELKAFLLHMEQCPGCREELEIYYTLIEATRQLDEGQLTTSDFMKELEDKIHRELAEIHAREVRKSRIKSLAYLLLIIMLSVSAIKIFDIPFPIVNPEIEISWEEQKEHINDYMVPYMLEFPIKPERQN